MQAVTPTTYQLSIVVPIYNEALNLRELVQRLDAAMSKARISYELICIDDDSSDGTAALLKQLQAAYPITVETKRGTKGKAFSLLQGFKKANSDYIAMIDADLQYPPEAIPAMLSMIISNSADIVIANRINADTSHVRRLASTINRRVIGKAIWGLDADVQTGLKVFRKSILGRFSLNPKPWTFDLEFLVRARNGGYRIASHDIDFAARQAGQTSIRLATAAPQIIFQALKLKFKSGVNHIHFNKEQTADKGSGFHYKGDEYVAHNSLTLKDTALQQAVGKQKAILVGLLSLIVLGAILNWRTTVIVVISTLTVMYLGDLLFNLNLIIRSLSKNPDIRVTEHRLKRNFQTSWPSYTVLCPMYKEAAVLPQFVEAMSAMDYDHSKLQIMLLLEADDKETIAIARNMDLPDYFEIVVVPHTMPKTKPKACNYGLLRATGEYVVIYDAEDIPDPQQLKKAYLAFKSSSAKVACIQSKLNFYNPHQNLLTRAFTAEYSLWFDLILPGMQNMNAPIPLGGTSNHFKKRVLIELGGWDAFNVTEDADLGMRLVKRGYTTSVLDSTTHEEANSNAKNWFWQRSRWIKGYLQTYLVHTRDIKAFRIKGKRNRNSFFFQLIIGGKVLSMLVNPILWLLTIVYFALRPVAGTTIDSLFPTPILYIGVVSLIFGNFLYMYYYMIGCARREHYELIKYALLIPFYWLAMSAAAYYALAELLYKPHHWRKTKHGLHLKPVALPEEVLA